MYKTLPSKRGWMGDGIDQGSHGLVCVSYFVIFYVSYRNHSKPVLCLLCLCASHQAPLLASSLVVAPLPFAFGGEGTRACTSIHVTLMWEETIRSIGQRKQRPRGVSPSPDYLSPNSKSAHLLFFFFFACCHDDDPRVFILYSTRFTRLFFFFILYY